MNWFRYLLPREDKFFDLFNRHSALLVQGAEALQQLLEGGENVELHCRRIVELENEADAVTQEVLLAVRRSFITPFDRGDIKDLIQSMDDAIDMMHKAVKTVTLFERRHFEPQMREMGALTVQAAKVTAKAIPLLQNIAANSAQVSALAQEVMKLEERADQLHEEGLKALFRTEGPANPMAYIIGSEIYSELERVMDRFEDVANEISGVMIENV
jgi:predicted phosphate transport protein (TIGR00153 family)